MREKKAINNDTEKTKLTTLETTQQVVLLLPFFRLFQQCYACLFFVCFFLPFPLFFLVCIFFVSFLFLLSIRRAFSFAFFVLCF